MSILPQGTETKPELRQRNGKKTKHGQPKKRKDRRYNRVTQKAVGQIKIQEKRVVIGKEQA